MIRGRAPIDPGEAGLLGWLRPRDGITGFTVEPGVTQLESGGELNIKIICDCKEGATIPLGTPIGFIFVPGQDLLSPTNRQLAATLDSIDKRLLFLAVQFECGSRPIDAGDMELIDW